MSGTQEAVRVAHGKIGREMAATDAAQVDLEEVTGVQPAQARREAEAGGIAADRLRSIVERIERLDQERKGIAENIKDIFTEAKSAGFDVKVVRRLLSIRKKEPAEVEEQETLLDLYRRALGM
jgi:uncharacterized protein (UPF0335 family)